MAQQLLRPVAVVDAWGFALGDPAGGLVGGTGVEISQLLSARFAALGRRVWHAPGDSAVYGLDFTELVAPGDGLATASLQIFTNTVAPTLSADFVVGAVATLARIAYARITGGVSGTDYQLRFSSTDTQGNVFTRAALLLCTQ